MKNGRMQAKDLPEGPLLQHLAELRIDGYSATHWTGLDCRDEMFPNSLHQVLEPGTPEKVVLAKMASMIRRKLVEGCTCGCRGSFRITNGGLASLAERYRDKTRFPR